jgi:hypothetical protein
MKFGVISRRSINKKKTFGRFSRTLRKQKGSSRRFKIKRKTKKRKHKLALPTPTPIPIDPIKIQEKKIKDSLNFTFLEEASPKPKMNFSKRSLDGFSVAREGEDKFAVAREGKVEKLPSQATASSTLLFDKKMKMACSPLINGKHVIKGSCYTADALEKIKIYYNKKNPTTQIKTKDPVELWKLLKSRLVECNDKKEDCWLNAIKDEKLKKELDEDLFAPDSPPEWTKNPNEWLSNFDISKVLKQYEEAHPEFTYIEPSPIDFDKKPASYQGSCVSDELCNFSLKSYINKGKRKIGFVFNLDEHTKGGSHWVSMFLDLDDKFIFYFNSTGEAIPKEIEELKDRIIEQARKENIELVFIQNHPKSHQRGNTECGMYSLFFIISMISMPGFKDSGEPEITAGSVKNNNLPKIGMFTNMNSIADQKMEEYRKIYFNSP